MQLTPENFGKCMSDSTRARITLLLAREGELCVCELTCALAESQPKISRHLALLRELNLLQDRRSGQWIYYQLHPQLPNWVANSLQIILSENTAWLDENIQRLAAMVDRPTSCR
jgi:ArsR family transcriptional regulator, arsenate/arsenite/antimonite-responsive transcriptional repressor